MSGKGTKGCSYSGLFSSGVLTGKFGCSSFSRGPFYIESTDGLLFSGPSSDFLSIGTLMLFAESLGTPFWAILHNIF